jgi:hypothetical protein
MELLCFVLKEYCDWTVQIVMSNVWISSSGGGVKPGSCLEIVAVPN